MDQDLGRGEKALGAAFPAILSRFGLFGIIVVTQTFIGHVNKLEFASLSHVQTVLVRFVSGITVWQVQQKPYVAKQAYGAGQYHMLGIYLQRSWIVSVGATTALIPTFIFVGPIFRLLGEEEAIAEKVETAALWLVLIMYSTVFSNTIQMYLQAQQKNNIIIWFSTASFILHVLLSWVFVFELGFGSVGAFALLVVSCWVLVAAEFVFVWGGWCSDTWKGFSLDAFSSLWPVIKVSTSSAVMICLEFWYNSVLILLAGFRGDAEDTISTFSICLNIAACFLMIGLGLLGATRGDTNAAKFSIKVIFTNAACFGLVFAILCLVFSYQLAALFSSSKEVDEAVAKLSYLLALSVFLNIVQPVLTGVAVGAGWQSAAAFVNIGRYYIVGVPIGALLGYVAHLEVKGIWIGLICGVVSQLLALVYMTWRTDWDEQVTKAVERLNRWLLKPSENSTKTGARNSVEE